MQAEPTAREKALASLVHLSTIPFPVVGPLAAAAIFRKSRYLTAHSLQALYELLVLKVVLFLALTASAIYSLSRIWHHYQTDWREFSWTEFLIRFVVGWTILALLGLFNTVQAIWAAYRAHQGKWPKNGRVVRAVMKRWHGDHPAPAQLQDLQNPEAVRKEGLAPRAEVSIE